MSDLEARIRAAAEERRGVNERTAVYHCYDATGRLIYAGATKNTAQRWGQHERTKTWWHQVVRIEVAWLDDRPAALLAERRTVINVLHEARGTLPGSAEDCPWPVAFAARVGWSKYQIATELRLPVDDVAAMMGSGRRARMF